MKLPHRLFLSKRIAPAVQTTRTTQTVLRVSFMLLVLLVPFTLFVLFPLIDSSFAQEPTYDAQVRLYLNPEAHRPMAIRSGDLAACRFKIDTPMPGIAVACPSYSNNIGTLRLSIRKWSESYTQTIAKPVLAEKTYVDFQDNESLALRFDTALEPGSYLVTLDAAVEMVGVWISTEPKENYPDCQAWFNGQPIDGIFQLSISFTRSPFPFSGNLESYARAAAEATCPPEPALSPDDPIITEDIMADTFAAIDDLGRALPDETEAGPVRPGKQVGIFYWTWHDPPRLERVDSTYNNTEILRHNPEAADNPNHPAWGPGFGTMHHWDKPLTGYYVTTDKWVLRRHAQWLAEAGVDAAIFDCTNGTLTWMDSTWALLETWAQARKDGVKTPKIAFMLPFTNIEYNAIDLRQLYRDIYRDGKFKQLWFYWQGKPLVYGIPESVDIQIAQSEGAQRQEWETIRRFFSFRPGQPAYTGGPRRADNWSWLEVYPQNGYGLRSDGKFDMVSVGVAQNHSEHRKDGGSGLAAMNDQHVFGRAYVSPLEADKKAKQTQEQISQTEQAQMPVLQTEQPQTAPQGPEAFKYGGNFAQQWRRAMELDPAFVFVTGWNEWIAGRADVWQGLPNAFPDQYDQRFSRDTEPCAGQLRDIYYQQLIANIRRFKGVRPAPVLSQPKTIDWSEKTNTVSNTTEENDPWSDVQPTFRDYRGDIMPRDHDGYAKVKYTDNTGRNDIIKSKVARDQQYVYFMVETADILTPQTDRNWMQLFISIPTTASNASEQKNTSWHGFQYVVNRLSQNEKTAGATKDSATKDSEAKDSGESDSGEKLLVERSTGGWNWASAGEADCRITGNRLELRISRAVLGLADGKPVEFRFKWADNTFSPQTPENTPTPDVIDFYIHGDSAPDGRFMYIVKEAVNDPLNATQMVK